jgi:hypothetical protein
MEETHNEASYESLRAREGERKTHGIVDLLEQEWLQRSSATSNPTIGAGLERA